MRNPLAPTTTPRATHHSRRRSNPHRPGLPGPFNTGWHTVTAGLVAITMFATILTAGGSTPAGAQTTNPGHASNDGVAVASTNEPADTTTDPVGQTNLIIGYEPNIGSDTQVEVVSDTIDGVVDVRSISPDAVVVQLDAAASQSEIDEIINDPAVRYVEPDHPVYLDQTTWDPEVGSAANWGIKGPQPRDGITAEPHGANAVDAWLSGATGSRQVYVGVLDSGVDLTHPELEQQIWVNPAEIAGNGIDDDRNGYIDDVHGWNPADRNGDVAAFSATESHGTRVAGVIGAKGGNAVAAAGVNWDVGIIPVRVFARTSLTSTSVIVAGVNYLVELKRSTGINLVAINASLGGGSYSTSLHDAIRRAGDEGILFVASAGNSTRDNDRSPHYPSSYDCSTPQRSWDCVIAVAAHRQDGEVAGFSSFGATSVDLSAPGSRIPTITPYSNTMELADGTSFSAPYVAGAIALCAGVNPLLDSAQIRSALLVTARPTISLYRKAVTEAILDIGALIEVCSSAGPTAQFIESVSLVGQTTARVTGWQIPPVVGAQPEFVVNNRQATVTSLEMSPRPYGQQGYVATIAATPGLNQICLQLQGGEQKDCTPLFIPAQDRPFGAITPVAKTNNSWAITGWAVDPFHSTHLYGSDRAGLPQISLLVDGVPSGSVRTGIGHPDFQGEQYVGWDPGYHGFRAEWQASPGRHTACVVATSVDGTQTTELGCVVHHQIAGLNPVGNLDSGTRITNSQVRMQGWALDPTDDGKTELHVFVNNTFAGVQRTGGQRPDIATSYPGYLDAAGFDFTVNVSPLEPANHVCVWAINKGPGTENSLLGCRQIFSVGADPTGVLDRVRATGPRSASVHGWTVDPDTSAPINVHIFVNGKFNRAATANVARRDVQAVIKGAGPNHGFNVPVTGLRAGRNTVCVFAINAAGGSNNPQLGCRDVTMASGNPIGSVDRVRLVASRTVQIRGWAVDPDTAKPISIHVWVNGRFATATTAQASRPDVDRAMPGYGPLHGYVLSVGGLRAGTNDVCVFAINAGPGTANTLLGCRQVAA